MPYIVLVHPMTGTACINKKRLSIRSSALIHVEFPIGTKLLGSFDIVVTMWEVASTESVPDNANGHQNKLRNVKQEIWQAIDRGLNQDLDIEDIGLLLVKTGTDCLQSIEDSIEGLRIVLSNSNEQSYPVLICKALCAAGVEKYTLRNLIEEIRLLIEPRREPVRRSTRRADKRNIEAAHEWNGEGDVVGRMRS